MTSPSFGPRGDLGPRPTASRQSGSAGAVEANPPIVTGTVWTCRRCGAERRRRVVPADHYNALAALIREVSDEVVLLPVSTLNAIAERAERAEQELRRLTNA